MRELNMDKYHETFPTRLRGLMDYNRLNTRTLAKKIGLSQQSIWCYCIGKTKPSLDNLVALANAFGVSVDYLLGVTDECKYAQYTKHFERN